MVIFVHVSHNSPPKYQRSFSIESGPELTHHRLSTPYANGLSEKCCDPCIEVHPEQRPSLIIYLPYNFLMRKF